MSRTSSFPPSSGISALQANRVLFEMTGEVPTKGQAPRKDLTTVFWSCKAREGSVGGERGKGTGGGGEEPSVLAPSHHTLVHLWCCLLLGSRGSGEEDDPFSSAQHVGLWFELRQRHLRSPSGINPHLCSTASIRWETTITEQMFPLGESGPHWCARATRGPSTRVVEETRLLSP